MTVRQYAETVGFEVIGKLSRKVIEERKYSWAEEKEKVIKYVCFVDEAGNVFCGDKTNGWCIIPADSADCV